MTIILMVGFGMGFVLAGFAGVVIILVSAIRQNRSMPWQWLRAALICWTLSAGIRLASLQLFLASKAAGESMTTGYQRYYQSVQFLGATFGFGIAGTLAAALAAALLLAKFLNRRSRQSSQLPPPPPEQGG